MGHLYVVCDAQAGSGGKGKVAAALAEEKQPGVVIANFGPNAGHTVQRGDKRIIFRHIPAASCVSPNATILLGPGSIIDPGVLLAEIASIESTGVNIRDRMFIHRRAAVVEPSDLDIEKNTLTHIASTTKGTAAAQVRKMQREAHTLLAGLHRDTQEYKTYSGLKASTLVTDSDCAMLEVAQGFDLDLNHGVSYPYCTSRQCSPAQAMADTGLPTSTPHTVIGVVRPYPIRVGNVSGGHSGPWPEREITWNDVAVRAGMPISAMDELLEQETTTVTGRMRRVFEFSESRFEAFCKTYGPQQLVVTFADQLDWKTRGAKQLGALIKSAPVREFCDRLARISRAEVIAVSTGPDLEHWVSLLGSK